MNNRLIYMAALAIAGVACAGCSEARSQKALASVDAASAAVGDFAPEERTLYQRGLAHIRNAHGRVGAYTIAQVIDDERTREANRLVTAAKMSDANVTSGEEKDVAAAFSIMRRSDDLDRLLRGHVIDGDSLNIAIDQNVWDSMSEQDRQLFKDGVWKAWAVIRLNRGHAKNFVTIRLYNLAQNQVDSETDKLE